MKLFYKKDYLETKQKLDFMNGAYEELSKDYSKIAAINYQNKDKINELETERDILKIDLALAENEISKLKSELRSINGAKGGLTKQNNKLKTKVQELEEENKKLKSNAYLRVQLAPDRVKKMKVMGIKRGVASKGAKAILKSKNESKEK